MIKELIKLANHLDKIGHAKEADYIDAVLKKISSDEDLDESRYIPEDYVTVTASNGEEIDLPKDMSGLNTGFAVIGNPYFMFPEGHERHDPHWRFKDGDTVIGVEEGTFGAMPVADAYQAFHWAMEQEKEDFDRQIAEMQIADEEYAIREREREADLVKVEGEEFPLLEGMGKRHSTKHSR